MTYSQMLRHIDDGGTAAWQGSDTHTLCIRRAGGVMRVRWEPGGSWGNFDMETERARWSGETFKALEE